MKVSSEYISMSLHIYRDSLPLLLIDIHAKFIVLGPLKTTAENLFARPNPFPVPSKTASPSDYLQNYNVIGLTQSTKLLQQYQSKPKTTPKPEVRPLQTATNTAPTFPAAPQNTPIDKNKEPKRRITEKNYERKSRNIPIRSQSFR